jgi:hypothetical protein
VSAAGVWLLVGLPVDCEQLAARLSVPDSLLSNDFCLEYAPPGWPANPPADLGQWLSPRFDNGYHRMVGTPLAQLVEEARAIGIEVLEGATLATLADAAKQASTIIIVSHWKAHEFVSADFLTGFDAEAKARLAQDDDPVAAWLLGKIGPVPRYRSWWQRPLTLRRALNQLPLAELPDPPAAGVDRFIELPATRAARLRDRADHLFEGLVRPGNRLELFDGLHAREAVSNALNGFSGTVDLTLCTSAWLGDYITRKAHYAIRTVQFPTEQEFHDAGARLTAVFDLMRQGADYLDARSAVATMFEKEVRKFWKGGR